MGAVTVCPPIRGGMLVRTDHYVLRTRRMGKVKVMGQAGENASAAAANATQSTRTGLRTLRKKAGEAGEVAGKKLTERGFDPQQLGEAFAENATVAREEFTKTTRRARKRIGKNAKRTRKELAESAKNAAKDAERASKKAVKDAATKADKKAAKVEKKARHKATKEAGGGRRRWPWLLAAGAAAGVAAYATRARVAAQSPLEQDLPQPREHTPGAPEHNGSGAHSRDDSAAGRHN